MVSRNTFLSMNSWKRPVAALSLVVCLATGCTKQQSAKHAEAHLFGRRDSACCNSMIGFLANGTLRHSCHSFIIKAPPLVCAALKNMGHYSNHILYLSVQIQSLLLDLLAHLQHQDDG